MGKRFEWYKQKWGTRQKVQETIFRNAEGIERASEYAEQNKEILQESTAMSATGDPFLDLGPAMMGCIVDFGEKSLPEMKQRHDEFVAEMKKPGPAYPQGVI
jgi:hypothetical protein